MSSPCVSVVMAVYNQEPYLAESLESLQAQTWSDFEILAINDGSTDATPQILDRFAVRDSRIVVVHQNNQGRGRTRQRGLELARGKYIAMMDPDDVAFPWRLERHVRFLDDHPEVACAGAEHVKICPFGMELYGSVHVRTHEEILQRFRRGDGDALTQGCCMIRSDAVRSVGGYNVALRYGEDVELFLRLAQVGRLTNLPWPAIKYRQHPRSANLTKSAAETTDLLQALNQLGYDWSEVLSRPAATPDRSSAAQTASAFHLRCARIAMNQGETGYCTQHLWQVVRSGVWNLPVLRETLSIAKDCGLGHLGRQWARTS